MALCDCKARNDLRNRIRHLQPTRKFWARHEQYGNVDMDFVKELKEEIQKMRDYNPRDHYNYPRYTNQFYGWITDSSVAIAECRCFKLKPNLTTYPQFQTSFKEGRKPFNLPERVIRYGAWFKI